MSALEVEKATGLWGYNDREGYGYGITAIKKVMIMALQRQSLWLWGYSDGEGYGVMGSQRWMGVEGAGYGGH